MGYKVEIQPAAQKQLLSLPREAQERVAVIIDSLSGSPRPVGCKKLRDTALWRTRVGKYRIVYTIDDEAKLISVIKVASRRDNI